MSLPIKLDAQKADLENPFLEETTPLIREETIAPVRNEYDEIIRNEALYARIERQRKEIMKWYSIKAVASSVVCGTSFIIGWGVEDPVVSGLLLSIFFVSMVSTPAFFFYGAFKAKKWKDAELKKAGLM